MSKPFDPKTMIMPGVHHWFEVASDGTLVDLMQPDEYAPLKAAVKEALDVETTEGDEGPEDRSSR